MSIYIQEVLNLLQRGKRKKKMDKVRDFFEFGKRYQTSSLSKGPTYQPRMEPFVINFGDLVCEITEDLTRTQPGSGNTGFIPVYTDPEGSCAWDTLMDSIMTQAGNTITVNNGNLVVDLQLTAGSANILDLTEDRVVIVGANGELEDDANFTFNGTELNIGQGNFTVQVSTGNTQIIGTLDVDGQSTLASANVEDLTEDRLVIAGVNGELEDSPNLTFDGTELTTTSLTVTDLTEDRVVIVGPGGQLEDDANFTFDGNVLLVNATSHLHGDVELGKTPSESVYLNASIVDGGGNVAQANQVLIGQADGTVRWGNDDIVETLTHGALWYGDSNNLKIELPISAANSILVSNGTIPQWQTLDSLDIVTGQGTVYRLPLWTPSDDELGDSILVQDGDAGTPATQVTVEGKAIVEGDFVVETNTHLQGNLEVDGTTKLDTVSQDDTLTQILVRDTANANEVKFRDASTIVPAVGFDTIPMAATGSGWISNTLYKNAFISLDDTTDPRASVSGMYTFVDGDRGVVVAENTKTGTFLADAAVIFPDYTFGSTAVSHRVSWPTFGATGSRGYQTSVLKFGESLKFSYAYRQPSSSNAVLYWDSCCKLFSDNVAPVFNDQTFNGTEDTVLSNSLTVTDNGYGGYGLSFTTVSNPANGTLVLHSNGTFTFTPDLNWYGTTTFDAAVTDGYVTVQAKITIVIAAVAESPVWNTTYTGPSQLVVGDTFNYAFDISDPDHADTELTVTGINLPSWLTLTYNNDGTGTLTGTIPDVGPYDIHLRACDSDSPQNCTDQQFSVGALVPTVDTYFVFWVDQSGSLSTLTQTMGGLSSITDIKVVMEAGTATQNTVTFRRDTVGGVDLVNFVNKPQSTVYLQNENPTVGTNGYSTYGSYGGVYNASYHIRVGMEVTGPGVPSGTTVTAVSPSSDVTLSNALIQNVSNQVFTFALTDQMKQDDYDGTNGPTFRSKIQDFYATGNTLAQEIAAGNTPNPATNGQDGYDSHVLFGHNYFENQVTYMANCGWSTYTGATGTGDLFEDASAVVLIGFGDESSTQSTNHTPSGASGQLPFNATNYDTVVADGGASSGATTDARFLSEIDEIKQAIADVPNSDYFRTGFIQIAEGQTGVDRNSFKTIFDYLDDGSAANNSIFNNTYSSSPNLNTEHNGNPKYVDITHSQTIQQSSTAANLMGYVVTTLNNLGYTTIT